MSLDGLPAAHLRVLLDGLPVFERYGLLLAGGYASDLDLETILDHLAGVSVFPDEDFAAYKLDEPEITDLRRWVTGWYDDLARRLAAEHTDELPDDL